MVERRPPKPEVEGSSPSSPAKKIMKFLKTYLKDVKVELRKVTWLSKQEMMGSTIIVGVFSVLISIFLFIVDFGVSQISTNVDPLSPHYSLINFK